MQIKGLDSYKITHVNISGNIVTVTYEKEPSKPKKVKTENKTQPVRDKNGRYKTLREKVKAIHDGEIK